VRQQTFERERNSAWERFEDLLRQLERQTAEDQPGSHERAEFPERYRELCQDLALARDRHFTEDLVGRLNQLALRGHEVLYAARPLSSRTLIDFVLVRFPCAVRTEATLVLLLSLLFFGSGTAFALSVHLWPDPMHSLLGEAAMAKLRSMYGSALTRDASHDVRMFGFYILNNVAIGFRTFAGGLFFGVGSLFLLLLNGFYIGLSTGYVIEQGMSEPFFSFVIGHSSLELVAIVLCAVAGLRLGLGLIAPGAYSRRTSLRRSAHCALPIVYGAAGMLVLAALIEGFWSASNFAPHVHYGVGATLWIALLLYFVLAGRRASGTVPHAGERDAA